MILPTDNIAEESEMKKVVSMFMITIMVIALSSFAFAAAPADEAKEMVEKAAAYYQANGKEKALNEYNNPKGQFVKGDLFIFSVDMNGISIANPHNEKQRGVNLLVVPDVDGKYFIKEMLELVNKGGTGWVDYKWKNYTTGKVDKKTSYVKKVGDILIGCGIFK
jgi:cytochrome c